MLQQRLEMSPYTPYIVYTSDHYPDASFTVNKKPFSAQVSISYNEPEYSGDIYIDANKIGGLIAALNEFKEIDINAIAWDELFPEKPLIERIENAILYFLTKNQKMTHSVENFMEIIKQSDGFTQKEKDECSPRNDTIWHFFPRAIERLVEKNKIMISGIGKDCVLKLV